MRAYYKGKLARLGRGAAEAEDLVQEAVLAVRFKRHTYDPAKPLTPWVHAIARYKSIDFLRRTRASRADVPIEEPGAITAHDDNVGAKSSYDVKRLATTEKHAVFHRGREAGQLEHRPGGNTMRHLRTGVK